MGRGNVCVTGPYEGLYYIDNDHVHVYRRDDPFSDEPETRLMGELDYGELTGGDWLYDDWGTGKRKTTSWSALWTASDGCSPASPECQENSGLGTKPTAT